MGRSTKIAHVLDMPSLGISESVMKPLRPREITIAGYDPDVRPNQIFPTNGVHVVPDDRFPGVILETLMGDWDSIAYERFPGDTDTPGIDPRYRMLYQECINEVYRACEIRRARGT